jgi:hypothetical protein
VQKVLLEEGVHLVSVRDASSALLEVKYPVKAGIIKITGYVFGDNVFADFAFRLSRFSNIANVFPEAVVA